MSNVLFDSPQSTFLASILTIITAKTASNASSLLDAADMAAAPATDLGGKQEAAALPALEGNENPILWSRAKKVVLHRQP